MPLSDSTKASIKDDIRVSITKIFKHQTPVSTKAALDRERTLSTVSTSIATDISVKTYLTTDKPKSTQHAAEVSTSVPKQSKTLPPKQSSTASTKSSTGHGSSQSTRMSTLSNTVLSIKDVSTLPHELPGQPPSKTSIESVLCKCTRTSIFT